MSDLESCTDFLQRLIRTPGLPGNEGATAELVRAEMEQLGYDEVHLDEAGNVLGKVPGRGEAPAMMFNTHLDHVDVGDHAAWPHPPFGGEIHDDKVWGRGAVDIKGPLACQVYGVARLLRDGFEPAGDVWVTATVQEEVGGLGARHMAGYIDTPLVVIGEPSRCELRRGHRGRTELIVHSVGRSVHASVPREGVNALDPIARLIAAIDELEMRSDPDLGTSTCVPSLIRTDQTSANVVPGEVWLTCDWRNVPGESGEDARAKLQQLADRALAASRAALRVAEDAPLPTLEVLITPVERASFSGMTMDYQADNPAYVVRADHPALAAAKQALDAALGHDVPVGVWQFATDGGHFALEGMVCVGFGPGDDLLAHTIKESIPIAELDRGLAGNEALARVLDARLAQ
ncbi:MAG: M20/M25/M40 family metallo-hydrolase [Acidobacteriota bacterium]|jgi:putative selenium metabolism hydrolase